MLRRDVTDLAARSIAAVHVERRSAFSEKIQGIKGELAAKGIVGGPTVTIVSDAAGGERGSRIDPADAERGRFQGYPLLSEPPQGSRPSS